MMRRRMLPENRTYIHHIQNPFNLDGQLMDSPLGGGSAIASLVLVCTDKAIVAIARIVKAWILR